MKSKPKDRVATLSVRAGERQTFEGAPVFPVWQTATFTFKDLREIEAFTAGKSQKIKYGRHGNPFQKACEEKLAALEAADGALLFPSGMSAITTTMLALLGSGDHVIYSQLLYRNSTRFFEEVLPRLWVTISAVPPDDPEAFRCALRPNTKVAFFEIPTNLLLRVPDRRRLAALRNRASSKPLLVVDSTFATPFNCRPLEFGADLVIHSLTKYMGGHDDLLAGCVCSSHTLLARVCSYRDVLGSICDPHNTFLCMRSLKSFPLRIAHLNTKGAQLAEFLANARQVGRIFYPGLRTYPDHLTARRLLKGFGSVIYFEVSGGSKTTKHFIEALRLPFIGTNFGGVHTFIEPYSRLTLGKLTSAQRSALGAGENLIRLCVGLEDTNDLIADIEQALQRAKNR